MQSAAAVGEGRIEGEPLQVRAGTAGGWARGRAAGAASAASVMTWRRPAQGGQRRRRWRGSGEGVEREGWMSRRVGGGPRWAAAYRVDVGRSDLAELGHGEGAR